jgi:hypothetical protein
VEIEPAARRGMSSVGLSAETLRLTTEPMIGGRHGAERRPRSTDFLTAKSAKSAKSFRHEFHEFTRIFSTAENSKSAKSFLS